MCQAQLARAARVAQPNLSAYENGRRTPTEIVLQRITRALKIPIADRVNLHRNAIHELVIKHHAPRRGCSDPWPGAMPHKGPTSISSSTSPTRRLSSTRSVYDWPCVTSDVEVDVVGADTLRREVRERILHEAVAL